MVLKCWQDPCNCASINGFRCKTWKDLFKLKCKHDDKEHSFGLSLFCCPCSCISLSCFLPCIACKEYQVYHTIKDSQDVLVVKQPRGSINTPEQPDDSMNESLYYEKSSPIPIVIKKNTPRLTII